MIETQTVLVLGAGASNHIAYPVGQALLNEVCERIRSSRYDYSIHKLHGEDKILEFFMRLSRSGYYSVDAFLEDNDDLVEVGKLLMAETLKVHEQPERVFPPGAPGWYQYLFNCLLTPSVDDVPHNKLSIITFNYDRSLEFYLHQGFIHRYRISEDESSQILSQLNIIHPHGILGDYPAIPYSAEVDGESLLKISSAIKVVHEIEESEEEFCTSEFRSCHDTLAAAEKIYFLGFGFHEDNVRRMGFFDENTIKEREVLATSQQGARGKERMLGVMEKYGFSAQNFKDCTCNLLFSRHLSLT